MWGKLDIIANDFQMDQYISYDCIEFWFKEWC